MVDICPIKIAIDGLKAGGFDTSDIDADVPKVMLGGSDTEYICDDITYEINLLTISVARAKLSGEKSESIFRVGENTKGIFVDVVQKSATAALLYKQYANIINLIDSLEKWLQTEIFYRAKAKQSINISLPEFKYCDEKNILIDNTILYNNVSEIVKYFNAIDLRALQIPLITITMPETPPPMVIEDRLLMGDIDELYKLQMDILLSARDHSQYQASIIAVIADIFNQVYKSFPNKL